MTEIQRGDQIDEQVLVDLLQRAQKSGDPQAFDGLYLLYADRVFRFLVARLEDYEAAEEIMGQVFLRLIENVCKYQISPKDNVAIFSAWLYRMAYNKMVDNLRKQKRSTALPIEQMEAIAERKSLTQEVEERVDFDLLLLSLGKKGQHFLFQLHHRRDAPVETKPSQRGKLDLDHVQPTGGLRRVVKLKSLPQCPRRIGRQLVIK